MRVVLWKAAAFPGCERASLRATRGGWELSGNVVMAASGSPVDAQYVVACDERWRTRSAEVNVRMPSGTSAVCWSVDESGLWWRGGQEVMAVRGCVDVDLGLSPSTNTLPIRRLALAVGATTEIIAAWVRIPELTIEPARQRYTRIDDRRYRFEADDFSAEIEVDDMGLVVHYAGGWERAATTDEADV